VPVVVAYRFCPPAFLPFPSLPFPARKATHCSVLFCKPTSRPSPKPHTRLALLPLSALPPMFYSHQLLARKAPLGQIWCARLLPSRFHSPRSSRSFPPRRRRKRVFLFPSPISSSLVFAGWPPRSTPRSTASASTSSTSSKSGERFDFLFRRGFSPPPE
jgi:hypothetical protein